MPILVVDDDGSLFSKVWHAGYDLACLLRHSLVEFFSLLVILVYELSSLQRLVVVVLYKQRYRLFSVLHSARSIDARADFEDDVAHGDILVAKSANVDDGFQTCARTVVDLAQSVESEDAVFAHDRHYVRSDTDCNHVEQWDEIAEVYAVADSKCLHKLESYTASRQVFVGIGGILALGVEDGCSLRQLIVRHVMVADNEVYALSLGICYFFNSLDATIEHDDKFYA